jgi:Amt family ammonium transporter
MMMNFMVYGVGMLAYWLIGFAIQMGGVGALGTLGSTPVLGGEYAITLFGKTFGLWGQNGIFLMHKGTYDVAVMVMFLFQMVFMDTALTIVTGTAAERWKYVAFLISSFVMGGFTYPLFANWAWGGGWLATLGSSYGLGHGYADFAGSGVVHSVGGVTALAMAIIIGPRIGKYTRQGKPTTIPGHDITMVLLGCFILAFGWFGFNPGSTLGIVSGDRIGFFAYVATTTNLAAAAGGLSGILVSWAFVHRKPDLSMLLNGVLAALVAITAACGFVEPWAAVLIGAVAAAVAVWGIGFVERLGIDDPIGAVAVHGMAGVWGTLATGLFAVPSLAATLGTGRGGLLYTGDPHQLGVQALGLAAVGLFTFTASFAVLWVMNRLWGIRVEERSEVDGLDLAEHGTWGYPEFAGAAVAAVADARRAAPVPAEPSPQAA